MGRSLRLATVQNVYGQGKITEEQARELLSGAVKWGDDSTIYDDSACLDITRKRNDRIVTALIRSNQEAELMTAAENRSKPMSLKREIIVVALANIAIYCPGVPRRVRSAIFDKAKGMIEEES